MGFLCAAALRSGLAPPVSVTHKEVSAGAVDLIMPLVNTEPKEARWQIAFLQLDVARRESLADFLLTIALRRARASQNLELLWECLRVGLHCDLIDGPAVRQGLALLRRATMLGSNIG
jgi:hypothetical protein